MTDEQQPTWTPSSLFSLAQEAVEGVVDGTVHVRGRVVDTAASRSGTQFVTIVDEDVEHPAWDTPRLGLVVFGWKAKHLTRSLGGIVSEVLTTGTVVDAEGELGLSPGRGQLQLRVRWLAVASDSEDAAAVAALRERIGRERWVQQRPPLPPVLRRVGALISVAGDGDLDEALRLLEHDAYAPAFCRHRIHPQSATARQAVPELLDHHVAAGVDAVLIAFGGHLPPVSPWDSVEVLEAVHRAHRAGVPVVAGFAHGQDQPLTKLVAHNHAQASAAVTALVEHNRRLLGRVAPALEQVGHQVEGATARVVGAAAAALGRGAATAADVTAGVQRTAVAELTRVADAATAVADRDRLGPLLPRVVQALGDPRPALTRRLAERLEGAAGATAAVRDDLDRRHTSAGQLPGLLHRGFALVTERDGAPLPQDRAPVPGTPLRITTAAATFGATVDGPSGDAAPTADTEAPADAGAPTDPRSTTDQET